MLEGFGESFRKAQQAARDADARAAAQKAEDRARSIRIEQKLDILIAALAEEEDAGYTPAQTLDGQPMGGERDQSQPL